MSFKYIAPLAISLFVVSCAKKDQSATILENETAVSDSGKVATTDSTISVANPSVVTAPSGATPNAALAGMNPEHGLPGHRCDIPVGAPLNSAPAQQPVQQPAPQVIQQPQVIPQQTEATTVTAPGMNPPHGEPGHRCDIPVGSPLS